MKDRNWLQTTIPQPDGEFRDAAMARQVSLTKPPGSLGRLESIAVEMAAMQRSDRPQAIPLGIAVFAADHGVAVEGVSAFPQEVTAQMVLNFLNGGAAISVLAEKTEARLCVVDAGTLHRDGYPEPVINRPVGHGTRNLVHESAMTEDECHHALSLGRDVMDEWLSYARVVIGGEMGIANTTSASALASALRVADVSELVGPGTGLDPDGISRKRSVVEAALERLGEQDDPLRILAELGGYEIAALTGFYLRTAMIGSTILVDGFISSVAALVACRLNPGARAWMLFSHASAEPGHRRVLEALNAEPLLDLGMRLGEGSGAATAHDLLDSACALHNRMATFAEAGVSDG